MTYRLIREHAVVFVLSAALVLSLVPSPVAASSVVPLSLEELVRASDAIVVGSVDAVSVTVNEVGEPWTRYDLVNAQAVKGDLVGDTFSFLCIGGSIEGRDLRVEGVPTFTEGDEVIVFWREDNELCQVAGWGQGVLVGAVSDEGVETVLDGNGNEILGRGQDNLVRGPIPEWRNPDSEGRGGRGSAARRELDASARRTLRAVATDIEAYARFLRGGRSGKRTEGTKTRFRRGAHLRSTSASAAEQP